MGAKIQFTTVEPLDLENMLNANLVFPNGYEDVTLANARRLSPERMRFECLARREASALRRWRCENNVNVNIDTRTATGTIRLR